MFQRADPLFELRFGDVLLLIFASDLTADNFLPADFPIVDFLPGDDFPINDLPGDDFLINDLPGDDFLINDLPGDDFLRIELLASPELIVTADDRCCWLIDAGTFIVD